MAHFDPGPRHILLRVVYEGARGVGKTTNLRGLARQFETLGVGAPAASRPCAGESAYFESFLVRAGVVCDLPLVCRVVAAPGHPALAPRRAQLSRSADVAVVVTRSDEAGVLDARAVLARRRGPTIVQANAQDRAGALDEQAFCRALARPASVVEACALDGRGVVDTFLRALQLVSAELSDPAARVAVARGRDEAALLEALRDEALDRRWAAERCLEALAMELA